MKQTAVVKKLRFMQMPTTACLYAVPSVANLPFRAFVPIAEQMKARGEWIYLSAEIALDETPEGEEQSREAQDTDPLLALTGTLECEVTDIDDTMPAEMQQTKTDQAREAQGTDPLLELIGTLECEVTDIGEHHDDYIGDALLTELREDKDE
jgi:hypothetical protein